MERRGQREGALHGNRREKSPEGGKNQQHRQPTEERDTHTRTHAHTSHPPTHSEGERDWGGSTQLQPLPASPDTAAKERETKVVYGGGGESCADTFTPFSAHHHTHPRPCAAPRTNERDVRSEQTRWELGARKTRIKKPSPVLHCSPLSPALPPVPLPPTTGLLSSKMQRR